MILLRGLRLNIGEKETRLTELAARTLHVERRALRELKIVKKSLDARKKSDIHWRYAVAVAADGEAALLARCPQAEPYAPAHYEIPRVQSDERPVVAGFGPAGMFAALVLAEAGLRPIVLERGRDVDRRTADVAHFWETGALCPASNVQFGEGGAGTFSDGKLNTGTHDARIGWVLERLRDFGAPESVTYDAKPHVGTDRLKIVVKHLRQRVLALGGEVRFEQQLIALHSDAGVLTGCTVQTAAGCYDLPCRALILAPGHSARDTLAMLLERGIAMERKPFSMGVRIEHRQSDINAAQYGAAAGTGKLPAADYKLNVTVPDGRGVYTFCMCPGGYVAAAASEPGGVCTNGMSYSGRGGENANAALLVTLRPEDFPGEGVLAGVQWQRDIEQRCFVYGGGDYRAPAQTVGDFLAEKPSTCGGTVIPTYRPGVRWGDLREALPAAITVPLRQAIPLLGRKLRGFDAPDAVLTAPETRSSSPVRILRTEALQSPSLAGLYPCGEGAGYAGGITSAAVDGMRCAEAVCGRYTI